MGDSTHPSAAYAAFAPGARVAGYRLEEQIGRGGMAVVFRAHDERLNRQVALKILAPVLAADEAFRQRFIAESQAAAAVDDPNIIPVYEAGEADGVLFIAMRLVRGGDLKTMVGQHGPLSPSRAEWILSAVASALDAAHAAGLVHRDVKPANMLLEMRPGRPDHVYLSDFGVSKAAVATTGLTGSGQFIGTVDYAAPEQIQDRAVDGRTDQYALGCSAFELLCGQPPFFGKQVIAGMYAHVSEAPPAPTSIRSTLPAAVDAVFARALAKSPGDRYASCEDFADDLRAALGIRPYAVDKPALAGMTGIAAEDEVTLAPVAAGHQAAGAGAAVSAGGDSGHDGSGEKKGQTPVGTEPLAALSMTANGHQMPGPLALGPSSPRAARRSGRIALSIIGAAVLLAGGAAGFVLATSTAAPASYRFAQQNYPGELALQQVWTLEGQNGSRLDATITVSNATAQPVTAQLEEPIPARVAGDPQAVKFRPVAQVLTASRVAVWDITLPARGHRVVRWQAVEPSAGATAARLRSLVSAFNAVAPQQFLEPIKPGGVLESVTITPRSVRLSIGQARRLRLRGTLSNHRPAPKAVLAHVIWSSAIPAIAAVNHRGRVIGLSAGVTQVTAQIGPVRESIEVIVLGPGGVVPTGGFSPPPGSSGGPSATPSVTPSSTSSPSPSVTSTPTSTPTTTPSSTGSPTPTQAATQGTRRDSS